MKALLIGNSQAGALKRAHRIDPAAAEGLDVHFIVLPGGVGPFLSLRDDRLQVTPAGEGLERWVAPPETDQMPVSGFDVVLLCAIGYVEGGYRFTNPITTGVALAEFQPLADVELVSDACARELVRTGIERQPGTRLLRELGEALGRKVIVLPFPRPSDALAEREEWPLRRMYADWRGAHRFYMGASSAALKDICEECGVQLLAHPEGVSDLWTDRALMRDDLIHANEAYGARVWAQIKQACRSV